MRMNIRNRISRKMKDQDQDQKDAQPGGVSSSKGFAIGRLVRRRRRSIQQDLEIKIFSFSPNVLF